MERRASRSFLEDSGGGEAGLLCDLVLEAIGGLEEEGEEEESKLEEGFLFGLLASAAFAELAGPSFALARVMAQTAIDIAAAAAGIRPFFFVFFGGFFLPYLTSLDSDGVAVLAAFLASSANLAALLAWTRSTIFLKLALKALL